MIPLLWLALSAAVAAPPDETIHTVIDMVYGKPVPRQAICIRRDIGLPSPGFTEDVVVVGITRPNQGCQLYGAFIDGTYRSPEAALGHAIDSEAWASADTGTRQSWLVAYTDAVLLAFHHRSDQDGPSIGTTRSGQTVVTTTYWRRSELPKVAEHTNGTFTFDPSPALVDASADVTERWQTTLGSTEYRTGNTPADAIHSALEQQGKTLKRCLDEAWTKDVTISGRHRMQFTLAGGSAKGIALVADDDDGSGIERCYSRALKAVAFPTDLSGTVIWSFSVVRRPVSDP